MPMPRPGTEVQMFGDSENGYVARNPATGKLERVVEGYDQNAGEGGWYTYWFESDPDKPADAQYLKFPNSYSSWDKFTEKAVPIGLGAIAGAGALGAAGGAGAGAGAGATEAGAAGAGGLSAADAGTLGAMTEGGVGAGGAGATGAAGAGATGLGGVTGAGSAGGYAMPAAVPESASTLAGWGMTETAPGVWSQAAATGGGTALSRLLNGTATTEDYLEIAGRAAPGLFGAYAANKQANSLSDLAEKYSAYGAPSRARYEASYAPGFTMANDPGYRDAIDQTTKATLHGLSVQGNPANSPNAWQKTLDDVNAKFAYPALTSYRNQNAATGGYGAFNTAAPGVATGAINADANVANALGGAAADIFSPPRNLSDLLREFKRAVA